MTIVVSGTPVVTPPTGGLVEPTGTVQGTLGSIGYFAVDTENNQIKIHGVDGTLLRTFGGVGTDVGKFFRPTTCSVVHGRQFLDRVVITEDE